MARWGIGAAALLVAVGTHLALGAWMFFGVCGISDVSDGFPAEASPQGRLCDGDSRLFEGLFLVGLPLGVVVSVALAVVLWPTRGRVLGWTAGVWVPLLAAAAFALPPDACTEEQRDRLKAHECVRTMEG